jgi:carbamoyltransferase
MKIVGLNHDMFISSAALVEDGQITAAAAEERFLRQKHTRKFPHHSLDYCLEAGNIDIQDVDVFVSSWNPGVYLESFNPLISDNRRLKAEYLYSIPDNIFRHLPEGQSTVDRLQQKFVLNDREIEVSYVTHHRAHAANGYFPSPFDEAAILTADSQGEKEAITFSRGQGHLIELLQAQNHPHSLGVLYSTITEYLGFRANSDEWKVMAVAANSDTKNQFDRVLE